MSIKAITQLIERLFEIHEQLYHLAVDKLEPIKKGDMKALEQIVREESKLAHKLQTTEMLRQKVVRTYLFEQGEAKEGATMTDVKRYATKEEAEKLELLQQQLLDYAQKLKQQNELNQDLIAESLRFVNLSLDLMVPHQEDVSYHPHEHEDRPIGNGRSIFDSKA
ncbi:flagellar protein FlgN [Halalkalibacter krulwichiae]|uniref:FlgN protein n=1 Tax=Halalkalibacter krulwichiae TaxID=199441 RepID=A0A1X9MF73_9BACI|nr:flagellar protein FlgN [Halalkalibacter krulwichiae]ARK32099.1 FlgN protein [Halalkalibacter krulwichiae]